jgi:ketosteroid isomerase-like protein
MTLTIAVLVLSLAPGFASQLPADLARAAKEYDRAQFQNDVATLERLVADDYVLVNSDASVQNKQQFLADFLVPGFKMEPYVVEEPIQRVWGNAAVLGGIVHLGWTLDGKRQSRTLRVMYVWAKRDGRWRVTYGQLTRVPA